MAILSDVAEIQKRCNKILALARAAQLASVILDSGDTDGETQLTITPAVKQQLKDRAAPFIAEIKTLAAGLPSSL